MPSTRLRKIGGSVMLTVPLAVLEAMHWQAGDQVDIDMQDGAVVLRPSRRRYTLEQLLAQCYPDAPISAEDQEWLADGPVGAELL